MPSDILICERCHTWYQGIRKPGDKCGDRALDPDCQPCVGFVVSAAGVTHSNESCPAPGCWVQGLNRQRTCAPSQIPLMPSPEERPKIEEASRLQANIDRLLVAIGDTGRCAGCNEPIVWVVHKNGKRAPYDRDAVNHFVTCEQRDRFRRGNHAKKEGTN